MTKDEEHVLIEIQALFVMIGSWLREELREINGEGCRSLAARGMTKDEEHVLLERQALIDLFLLGQVLFR